MEKVGFIGLGIMGRPMALNLLRAGFPMVVYNRTEDKTEALVREGAVKASSPAEVAGYCPVVITIVSDTPDVQEVILGDNGVVEGVEAGSVIIDMSTISPRTTREIALRLEAKGAAMLDAPVSGGDVGARQGTLSIMVGGDEGVFDCCRHILSPLGKSIVHVGPNGMGQTVKLMNQILVAGHLNALAEALVFAQKSGADLRKAISAVEGGAAGSWALSNLGPKIIKRDFEPGFMVDLIQKDLNLVVEAAREMKLPLFSTALIHNLYYSLQCAGEGKKGTQALVRVLERISGVQIESPNGIEFEG